MGSHTPPASVVRQSDLGEYFRHAVRAALREGDVDAHEDTETYLADLLARFTRSERLFARTPDGVTMRTLADCYAEATRSESPAARCHALRTMGDVALFVAGVLPDSLRRRAVDVDYYVAMGGGAYSCLAETPHADRARGATRRTYGELARKFIDFVDVLACASERDAHDDRDLLRLYETWRKTGSRRAEQRLRRAGITPLAAGDNADRRH